MSVRTATLNTTTDVFHWNYEDDTHRVKVNQGGYIIV